MEKEHERLLAVGWRLDPDGCYRRINPDTRPTYAEALKSRPPGACYCDFSDEVCYLRGHWNANMTSNHEARRMSEADGFRTEAAVQFGFTWTNDDADEYACTEAALIAFAKGCERKGMADAREIARRCGAYVAIARLDKQIAVLDAELKPILEAERQRSLTAAGHVPVDPANPTGGWVKKPEPLCEDEGCPHHGTLHVCVTRADRYAGITDEDLGVEGFGP
jgi:hypothetical protein